MMYKDRCSDINSTMLYISQLLWHWITDMCTYECLRCRLFCVCVHLSVRTWCKLLRFDFRLNYSKKIVSLSVEKLNHHLQRCRVLITIWCVYVQRSLFWNKLRCFVWISQKKRLYSLQKRHLQYCVVWITFSVLYITWRAYISWTLRWKLRNVIFC